ncbi:MAG: metal ABC transporter ATP-binding protein [Bacillota bacterium]
MEPVIASNNLSVTLNGKTVLEKISFAVRAGEMVGIIGPNGAGKTTLLRAILGLIPLNCGTLKVLGMPPRRLKTVRDRIGYMPQRQLFERRFPLSVSDVVAMGLLTPATMLHRVAGVQERVAVALQSVGMEQYGSRPFQDLSGGEQQRILLARSIVRKPALLLLDEPNTGLDFPAQQRFLDLLRRLQLELKLTVLLVSHDLVSVTSVADSLICINRIMHVHGCAGEVLQSPGLEAAYRCQFDLLNTAARMEGDRK